MHTVAEMLSVIFSRSGLSEILIGSTLKGTVVLLLCLAALALWKRSAAATRHVILTAGLASCLLIPLVSVIWIGLSVSPLSDIRVLGIVPLAGASYLGSAVSSQAIWTLPGWWGLALMVWALGAVLLSVRALGGVIRVRLLLMRAEPVIDVSIQRLFDECLKTSRISRRVRLVVHPTSHVPFTCGLFRPTLVLTQGALDLAHDEIRRVLLHELAHVKRIDVVTNMTAQAVFAIFWFNPLVWLALRQIYHEQERACDDFVLACGEPAAEYAELLLNFARSLSKRIAIVPAGMTFVRASSLAHRIQSLFKPGIRTHSAGLATVVALAAVAAASVGILSCVRTPTTENAPTSEAAKADAMPSPDDFVEVDETPVEISHENPVYPETLAEQGIGGELWMQALVDQTGRVSDARVLKTSGYQEFDKAALEAAYKNEFKPAQQGGKPVSVWVAYKVVFKWAEQSPDGEKKL